MCGNVVKFSFNPEIGEKSYATRGTGHDGTPALDFSKFDNILPLRTQKYKIAILLY